MSMNKLKSDLRDLQSLLDFALNYGNKIPVGAIDSIISSCRQNEINTRYGALIQPFEIVVVDLNKPLHYCIDCDKVQHILKSLEDEYKSHIQAEAQEKSKRRLDIVLIVAAIFISFVGGIVSLNWQTIVDWFK